MTFRASRRRRSSSTSSSAPTTRRTFWQANKATFESAVKAPMVDALRGARRVRTVPPVPAVQRPAVRQGPAAVQDRSRARTRIRGRHRLLPADLGDRPDVRRRLLRDGEGSARALPRGGRPRRTPAPRSPPSAPAVTRAGNEVGAIDELKSAPRGYAKDHPRVDLLRRKGLMTSKDFGAPAWIHTKQAVTKVRDRWRAAATCAPGSTPTSARARCRRPTSTADVGTSDAVTPRWASRGRL